MTDEIGEVVIVNCPCGMQWKYPYHRFWSLVYHERTEGLRCDICGVKPNINYGGMTA